MIFIRIGFLYYSVCSSTLGSNISCKMRTYILDSLFSLRDFLLLQLFMLKWSVFTGHITQEWIKLHKQSRNTTTNKNQQGQSYLWRASVVEVLLSEFVRLWEIRNEEVHGKTKERNETLQKKKLTSETKRLNSLKDDAQPGDRFLFHDNVDEFIEKSSAKRIGSWVRSHRIAIKNSVNKWKNHQSVERGAF